MLILFHASKVGNISYEQNICFYFFKRQAVTTEGRGVKSALGKDYGDALSGEKIL